MNNLPKNFLEKLNSITAKRPRTVIQHILKNGFVTTEDLKNIYGYNHPPRAIRDVREHGIPIETYRVTGSDGRSIGAYRFGNPDETQNILAKKVGRTVLSKNIKDSLIAKYGPRCFIYCETVNKSDLQIDHRIPYEINGEEDENNIENYMLLSPSANRAKSWACEQCQNWNEKNPRFCIKCFWAYPENHIHVAGKEMRVISIFFSENEVKDYDKLIEIVGIDSAQQQIKELIHRFVK